MGSSRIAMRGGRWPVLPSAEMQAVRTSSLGVHPVGDGADVGVVSEVADRVEICVFEDGAETRQPLDRDDAGVWRGHVAGLHAGGRYGLRVWGPWDPANGLRCNPAKLLLDPYARAVDGAVRWGAEVVGHVLGDPDRRDDADSAPFVPRSVVTAAAPHAVAADRPRVPWPDTVIYEVHVKGFTASHPGVPGPLRGTYAGLASPAAVDHLRRLGVTTVELMPVQQFVHSGAILDRGLRNYWGYDPIAYFAPHGEYAASGAAGGQVAEFKKMVSALHAAELEVLCDVVFNHTAEGDENGPTLCYRGLDNAAYYRLVPGRPRHYYDTTGTGNSIDLAHPAALRLVLDALRYWVTEMDVDGFRFDLASTLARDESGRWDVYSAFLDAIAQDPVLSTVKLVAEPWDGGDDGYEVGRFPAGWHEWNGRYRDDVRDYWRGVEGKVPALATRLTGSSDLYPKRGPAASVNFVTCHDGFTLRDLTSYDVKHNEANGGDGRDGTDDNRSWNCGVEGDADDPAVSELRARQRRNLLTTLLISEGVPMLSHGDELGRTQRGNNNAYCQDNPISWIDWEDAARHADLTEFTAALVRLRKRRPSLHSRRFPTTEPPVDDAGVEAIWLRPDAEPMTDADWRTSYARAFGLLLRAAEPSGDLFIAFNAYWETLTFAPPAGRWGVVLDTASAAPAVPAPTTPSGPTIDVGARSTVILGRLPRRRIGEIVARLVAGVTRGRAGGDVGAVAPA
jgi:glycogen operon protein